MNIKKNTLDNKLRRIENGFSVSPAYSEYIINQFAAMPVPSGNGQTSRCLPGMQDIRMTISDMAIADSSGMRTAGTSGMHMAGKSGIRMAGTSGMSTIDSSDITPAGPQSVSATEERTFSALAREITAGLHSRDVRRPGDACDNADDAEELCRAYFRLLYEADPSEYRQLQKRALVNPDAEAQLARQYPPEKEMACKFLEVPLCEYKEHIYAAGVPMRTRVFIDNTCRAAGISDGMRLADVWAALLHSSEETYLTVKRLHDEILNSALMKQKDAYPSFQMRRLLPLIEFFVSPMASAAKEASPGAGHSDITTSPVTGKELNYENK